MKTKLDAYGAKWGRVKRTFELVLAGVLLAMGVLLFLALLPSLPGMLWDAVRGDAEAVRGLISAAAAIGLCWVQWEWRAVVYPQLRREARKQRETGLSAGR